MTAVVYPGRFLPRRAATAIPGPNGAGIFVEAITVIQWPPEGQRSGAGESTRQGR